MDRGSIAALDTERIPEALEGSDFGSGWSRLVGLAAEDAVLVLRLVCRLTPPERIAELRSLETEQAERGAGFLGMLPDQIPDDLGAPVDLETSLDVAIRLAEIRAANLESLAETMPNYPLSFAGNEFEPDPIGDVPPDWKLKVDVEGIRAALDFFDALDSPSLTASEIARMPAFTEMIRHRRELGYVPEPLIDEAGLAWCLEHAASDDPVDMLWKWLHPQNFFDLSDLYTHRAEYRRLIDHLVRDGGLSAYVLSRLAPYAPPEVAFMDRLSFAVGWAINGWATQETGGMNIEHAKDHFERMLPTLVHETFHRLQVSIALGNPEIEEAGFDQITSYPFEREEDCRLYQALCYIMLEGSATYAASPEVEESWMEDTRAALDLLERIRTSDWDEESGFEGLLHEGLRSNGPFYGFGALLSNAHVENGGPPALGTALRHGAPGFIERGLAWLGGAGIGPSADLTDQIAVLRKIVEPSV